MDGLTITKLIMTQFTPIPNDTRFHFFCNQLNKLNFQEKKKKKNWSYTQSTGKTTLGIVYNRGVFNSL